MVIAIASKPWSLTRSYRYCETVARREAANFYHAFRLLPKAQRLSTCALYSFLRIADDLADADGDVDVKRANLEDWRRQLQATGEGHAEHPVFIALAHTIAQYAIPVRVLESALDGVCMDLTVDRYDTFDDLYRYCYHVASVVGLSCIHVWGYREPEALRYAEAAGIAFQLTNVLRDLPEDAERGRIYLPGDDLRRFSVTEDELRRGDCSERFRALMQFEVERARGFYAAAEPLAGLLPRPGRAVFLVMLRTYRALLDVIECRDYDVFRRRARVSRWRKLWLVLQVLPIRIGLT